MKTTSHGKPFRAGFLSFCVSLLLIAALTTPAPANIFANPGRIEVLDALFNGAGNPYPSKIVVSNLPGLVTDVRVRLRNINHPSPSNLDILLAGPVASNNIMLMSDAGGNDDQYNVDLVFHDSGVPLTTSALPSGSVVRPSNLLGNSTMVPPAPIPSLNTSLNNTFMNTEPNGTWSLYVVDDIASDMGAIGNSWSLTITTTQSVMTTFSNDIPVHCGDGRRARALPYASTIPVEGMVGAITDVNVTLSGVTHDNPDDLDILLVGPSGKRILLLSDAGGTPNAVNINMTFDDEAEAVVPDDGPLTHGRVRPTNFGIGDTLPDLPEIYPSPPPAGAATLASVFNGTRPNGVWKLYIVDDAIKYPGNISFGWSIDITADGVYGASRFTNSDFDGDGLSDTAVFGPVNSALWRFRDSSSTFKSIRTWVMFGDIPVPGDYDADGKTDMAVYRPGTPFSQWVIEFSSTGFGQTITTPGATLGDIPVPQDYDGNGKTDIGVFQPSGIWRIKPRSVIENVNWGQAGDIPVRGHFFGTEGADFAVFRPSTGTWYILNNERAVAVAFQWGVSGDQPVPGDYDGDGRTDLAVYRPSNSDWYILLSSTGSFYGLHHGSQGDIPVPGDYDGDTITDIAVWSRGSGAWYIYESGTPFGASALKKDVHGVPNDIPIAKYYLP